MFRFNRYIPVLFYKYRRCRSYTRFRNESYFRHDVIFGIIPGLVAYMRLVHDMVPFPPLIT
jgi:hypothetical protein